MGGQLTVSFKNLLKSRICWCIPYLGCIFICSVSSVNLGALDLLGGMSHFDWHFVDAFAERMMIISLRFFYFNDVVSYVTIS
jgi:hypothetical protein